MIRFVNVFDYWVLWSIVSRQVCFFQTSIMNSPRMTICQSKVSTRMERRFANHLQPFFPLFGAARQTTFFKLCSASLRRPIAIVCTIGCPKIQWIFLALSSIDLPPLLVHDSTSFEGSNYRSFAFLCFQVTCSALNALFQC